MTPITNTNATEMTLEEWVDRLPESHGARNELTQLNRVVQAARAYLHSEDEYSALWNQTIRTKVNVARLTKGCQAMKDAQDALVSAIEAVCRSERKTPHARK